MKFNYIVGNPPYKKNLHFKISNICFNILENNGQFLFIQPAAAFFNKNKKPPKHLLEYKNILVNNHTKCEIVPGISFNAGFLTDLAITVITKNDNKSQKIDEIKYKGGDTYFNISLEDISITQIDPKIYKSIRKKYEKYIKKYGSLKSLEKQVPGITISGIRGNVDQNTGLFTQNFYSFYSPPNYKNGFVENRKTNLTITIKCKKEEAENVYDYLEKLVPKMGLALYKYSSQTFNFQYVPLVDFSKKYSEEELFDMLELNEEEIKWIKAAIPEYSARLGKNKELLYPFEFKKPV